MDNIEFSEHWQFAYLSAIIRLQFLIWEFDFEREVKGKNYIDFPSPNRLVSFVDGFMSDLASLPQGEKQRLLSIRERLSRKIVLAYDVGVQKCHELWNKATSDTIDEYMKYDNVKIRNQAGLLMPSDWSLAEKSWYIEAFCKTWQQEIVESFRKQLDQE